MSSSSSHPRRDTEADADISLERKRPRLSDNEESTPPVGSPVIEVIDDDSTPSTQESVMITSTMDDPSGTPELLRRFPLIGEDLPSAQAAAHCLADEIIKNEDVDYPEMEQFANWLSDARAAIENDSRYFEHSQFWFEVSRIITGLLQRDSLGKPKFPYEKMGPVLATLSQEMARICALSLEHEAVNIERGVSRRDSVRAENANGIEDAPYKPLLAPIIDALNKVLQPKCELYVELRRRQSLARFAVTTLAANAFTETSRELEVLTDLFTKYMANMTALESPYSHILQLAELSSHILDVCSPDRSAKLSPVALERISAIFDETYFTVYQKMMSIQSRELPELHNSALEMLQVMVHCLSRHHDGFAQTLFAKLVQRASQRMNQSQGALEAEIAQTHARCQTLTWDCTPYLFKLDMALGLIRSGIRDHRITGITLSNNTLLAAWNDVKKRRGCDGDNGKDSLCQTLALCCLHLDFMGVIFSPDAHADVISQGASTVEFLLVTDRLATAELDTIWAKLSSSSQPDMIQACISNLIHLTVHFTPSHISHILGKLAESQAPPIAMWRNWITAAGKRVRILSEIGLESSLQLEIAEKLVTLLEHLSSFEVVENIDVIVCELLNFLSAVLFASSQESTTHLVEHCVFRIGKGTRAATGSVYALISLLSSSSNATYLCKDVSIFDAALSELRAYTLSKTRGEPEAAPWSSHELASRVQLVLYALTTLNEADATSFEETIWSLIVGADAIGHAGRVVGVRATVEWFSQRHGLSGFGRRCVDTYLPQLPAEYASPGLQDFHSLLESGVRSPSSAILDSTLLEQLIRLSLSTSDRDLSAAFEIRVCSWLFGKVAQEHHEEAQQAQAAVTQQCLHALTSGSAVTQLKALHLLKRLVCDGSAFERATTTKHSVMKLGVFEVGTPTGDQGQIKVNVEALCTPEPSKQFSLLVAPATSLSELKAAVLHHTGFSQLRAHSSGKAFDLDTPSSVRDSGLTKDSADCALLVQRVWSAEEILNSDTHSQSDSAIQQTLIRHHSQIHALLDNRETAEQAYMLLKYLPVPVVFRVSVAQLQSLPSENCWKAEYSMHVLQVILSQQISHGIADAKFISQSIRLLVDVLVQNSEGAAIHPLKTAVTALLSFLKEQPVQDVSSDYFENPQQFIHAVMQILTQLTSVEVNDSMQDGPSRAELAEKSFACLLEAMMSCSPIRTALLADEAFKEQFKSLLRSRNYAIASVVGQSLANLCKATCLTPELTSLFWTCIEDLIGEIAAVETTARAVFDAASVLLQFHKELLSNETSLRSLVDKIVDLLWKIQPEEAFNSSNFDHRIRLLCVLLRCCVVQMKSSKQPLNLGQLAVDLFQKLLFPEVFTDHRWLTQGTKDPSTESRDRVSSTDHGKPTRAIKHVRSRQVVFELIGLLCDDTATHVRLVDATRAFHYFAEQILDKDQSLYPGREIYLREEQSHVGLINLGQTCYLNSLLQQLFMNYDFRKFILEINIPEEKQDPVLVHFRELFSALHFSNISCHAPGALAEILGIDVSVQEDAHLFFTMLISRLEDSMPDKETKEKLQSFFGGRNRSQTKGECGHVSESTDDYLNLSLTVKDKINLTESLQEYVAGASLEGGDKFKCTTCEEEGKQPYVNAMRRTGLETIPNTLILGLKRFRYESWDGGTKVNDRFEFPAELDMAPFKLEYLANPNKPMQADNFELIGVIVHQGTLQIGHYWSYAKDHRTYGQQPGSWFRMEDATVRSCDLEFILRECMGGEIQLANGDYRERSDSAYILIYRRLTASSAIEKRIVRSRLENPRVYGQYPHNDVKTAVDDETEEDLKNITDYNSVLETKVHLYDVAHTQYIQQLLSQMDTFAADLDRQHESHAVELSLMHLRRVTAKVDITGNLGFQRLVEKTALRSIQNSKYLLCYVFDHTQSESFLFGTPQLRMAINVIVLSTLRFLHREDPRVYGQYPRDDGLKSDGLVYDVLEEIGKYLSTMQHRKMSCWGTYFDLVATIAGFGVRETKAVLDLEFLEWCLDVFLSRYHPEWSKLGEDGRKGLRKGKSICLVLAETIDRLLEHVDLSRKSFIKGSSTRPVLDGECSLSSVEVDLIHRHTSVENDRSILLRSLCQDLSCSQGVLNQPTGWSPYRLIQTLMKADDYTVEFLLESLEFYFFHMPGNREGCTGVAIGICLSTTASTDAKNRILKAVTASVHHTKATHEALWFFEAITEPMEMSLMIWQSLEEWYQVLIRPDDSFVPEETFKWLCRHMLLRTVFTVPSSEASLATDFARIEAAIYMHKWVRKLCIAYMNQRADIQSIDSIFRTFFGVQKHLRRVFSIFVKGSLDRPRLMKDILSDTDLLEFSEEEPDSQNPLIQHGGTISLPHEVEDLISSCTHFVAEGNDLMQQIEVYRLEEAESDDEEDYEEDPDNDEFEFVDC